MVVILAMLGAAWASEGACAAPASLAELDARMAAAEAAWLALDLGGFRSAADDLAGLVPCVDEALGRERAALVHRLQGMRAFVQDDTQRAELAFAASRRLQPGVALDERLAPAQHPIRRHYAALPIDDLGELRIEASGTWLVDGTPSPTRPTRLPTIVQRAQPGEGAGAVSQGWYLWPGEELVLPTAQAGPGRWLALGGGVAVVAAGGSYLGAVLAHRRYDDPSTPRADLDGLRSTTNALVITSAGLATAGLGLGVASLTVEW
jgi:hypothetical protein